LLLLLLLLLLLQLLLLLCSSCYSCSWPWHRSALAPQFNTVVEFLCLEGTYLVVGSL
jgi:hypothetical protein